MSWALSKLENHIDLLSGPAFKSAEFTDDVNDIPLVKGENIGQGKILWSKSRYWPKQKVEEYKQYQLDVGDVILAMDRPWVTAGLKYSWIRPGDPPALLVQRAARMRGINGLRTDYLRYIVGSKPFSDFIKNIMRGTNIPHISGKQIKLYEFLLPSTREQDSIVDVLSVYDDLIGNNYRRIKLLKESAQQLYKEWFVRFRFPGHEYVKVVDGVPEGWRKNLIKDVLTLNYGKALKAETRIAGNIPVYGSSGVIGSHSKALVKGPGIVVGRKGNVGSIFWVHADFFPIDTVYFVTAEESDYFIYFALLYTTFINTDVAVPGLNRDMAYSREILLPKETLRTEFTREVAPIFEQCNVLRNYNDKLLQARDLLLPKLISGEIAA